MFTAILIDRQGCLKGKGDNASVTTPTATHPSMNRIARVTTFPADHQTQPPNGSPSYQTLSPCLHPNRNGTQRVFGGKKKYLPVPGGRSSPLKDVLRSLQLRNLRNMAVRPVPCSSAAGEKACCSNPRLSFGDFPGASCNDRAGANVSMGTLTALGII
jgi:hypothetical protein